MEATPKVRKMLQEIHVLYRERIAGNYSREDIPSRHRLARTQIHTFR